MRMEMKMRNNLKGFTMLELLIATSILTFIIAGMTIALQQQQRQFNITKETVDIDQTGRTLLDFISSEVRNAGARQGKNFSVEFTNGGSILDETTRCDDNAATSLTGSKDSPPDCVTLITWDISRGMVNDPSDPSNENLNKMPSTTVIPQVNSTAGGLKIDLPDDWFDTSGEFLDSSIEGSELIGARSRINLCNPDSSVDCLSNPERCTECAIVFKGIVDTSTKELIVSDVDHIFAENFPVDFSNVSELISGKSDGITTYGFIQTISSQASELSIVKSKTFRLNPEKRELELSEDGGEFMSIAGGETDTPEGLESPGVVDLQFVFNIQDPDGSISKVGKCDSNASPACNNTTDRLFDDFEENEDVVTNFYSNGDALTCCSGREQDIRSVEIYLVLKSKIKPRKLRGGLFSQTIPEFADVAERSPDTGNQSDFLEPEEGFMYRVFSTTVYMRNIAREDFG